MVLVQYKDLVSGESLLSINILNQHRILSDEWDLLVNMSWSFSFFLQTILVDFMPMWLNTYYKNWQEERSS